MKKYSVLAVRIFLGGVFVYASIDKILHPADFAEAVFNYQILPDILINPAALILPWTELAIGISLIFGVWIHGAIFLANLLLSVFLAALTFNLARGLNVHCGCFSAKGEITEGATLVWTILRDIVFFLMGVFLFLQMYFENRKKVIG